MYNDVKIKILLFLNVLFISNLSFGTQLQIYIPGLSYHIGANSSHPADTDAPNKLDSNGAFVFNPGLGLGVDFFRQPSKNGFSLAAIGMFFKDCDRRNTYVIGLGPSYQHYLTKTWSLDADIYLSKYKAQNWETSSYTNSFVPFASLGIDYNFRKVSFGIKFTFSPKNTAATSTSGFNIIFAYLFFGVYI